MVIIMFIMCCFLAYIDFVNRDLVFIIPFNNKTDLIIENKVVL